MKKSFIILCLTILTFSMPVYAKRTTYNKATNMYYTYDDYGRYEGKFQMKENKVLMWDKNNRYIGYNAYLNDEMYRYNEAGVLMMQVPVTVVDKSKSMMKYTADYVKKNPVKQIAKPMTSDEYIKAQKDAYQAEHDRVEKITRENEQNNYQEETYTSSDIQGNSNTNSTIEKTDKVNNTLNTVNSLINLGRSFVGY